MIRCILLAAAVLAAIPSHAADVGLQPTTIQLDARRDRATVLVHNRGAAAVTLQADGRRWTRDNGEDSETETTQLLVNPAIFTIAPGATQLVRVGLRRGDAPADVETCYRLLLREVPTFAPDANHAPGQVKVLLAFKLPIYVAPAEPKRADRWTLARDARGDGYVATVTNTGNVHLRWSGLRLQDHDATTFAEHGPMPPLFPGETRAVVLRPAAALPPVPLRLELRTHDEVRHAAIAIGAAP